MEYSKSLIWSFSCQEYTQICIEFIPLFNDEQLKFWPKVIDDVAWFSALAELLVCLDM